MKPAKFEYFAPSRPEEVFELLEKYGDDAKILAGGQSLMPLLNMRLAAPKVLVDINKLPGLDYVREADGEVAIGALTRHRTVEKSTLLKSKCPLLPTVAENVAHIQVRNRGTFGGSIAHSDPAAEFPAVVFTLGGTVVCRGPGGVREVPVEEFNLGMMMTTLEPAEIVTEVRVPSLAGRKWSHKSIERCHGDFAVAGVIASFAMDAGGLCRDVHLGMYGVGPSAIRSAAAEGLLEGAGLSEKIMAEAAEAMVEDSMPESDLRGTAEYRRKLLRVLVPWCLSDAAGK